MFIYLFRIMGRWEHLEYLRASRIVLRHEAARAARAGADNARLFTVLSTFDL